MIEGSGSGSIPLTSGSGSGRPKNKWIRIRNTDVKFLSVFWIRMDPVPTANWVRGSLRSLKFVCQRKNILQQFLIFHCCKAVLWIQMFLDLRIQIRHYFERIRILIIKQKPWFLLFCDFSVTFNHWKRWKMHLKKSKKNVGVLKVTDEKNGSGSESVPKCHGSSTLLQRQGYATLVYSSVMCRIRPSTSGPVTVFRIRH